jgi:hypothetical protein
MDSQHLPALVFRSPSLDLVSVSDSSAASTSIYTDESASIADGIGASGGRLILSFGKKILRAVENVTVIRRRLAYIQTVCPFSDDTPPEDVLHIYDDLTACGFGLSRPASLEIWRKQFFCIAKHLSYGLDPI